MNIIARKTQKLKTAKSENNEKKNPKIFLSDF